MHNFGFDVDTNIFKLESTFSNSYYNTQSYLFRHFVDDSNYIEIMTLDEALGLDCSDSLITFYVNTMSKLISEEPQNDTIKLTIDTIGVINNYQYFIAKGGSKTESKEQKSLWGFGCYQNYVMKVNCYSGKNSKISDADLVKALDKFSKGITFYTSEEVMIADSVVLVSLTPKIEITDSAKSKGFVWLEGKKNIDVIEAGFESSPGSYQVFKANVNNKIAFEFYTFRLGKKVPEKPIGKGYFVLRNKLGKEVKLKFDFSKKFND